MINKIAIFFLCVSLSHFMSGCSGSSPEKDLPTFSNVMQESGITQTGALGHPATWSDYDSDGFLDLFLANGDFNSQNLFVYKNMDGSTFKDVTDDLKIEQLSSRSMSWGDYNNDGFPDLSYGTTKLGVPPLLYKNEGGSSMKDVTEESNINVKLGGVFHAVWGDYNNDSHIDLLQANMGVSYLYKNNGDGTFTETSELAGFPTERLYTKSAIWFDSNNNGFLDMFMAIREKGNRFFINNGDGTFTEKTAEAGLKGEVKWRSNAACTGDINNDGFIDLYIGNSKSSGNALYLNNGNGTFTNITADSGTSDVGDARTCALVDFNGDGLIDIFATNHNRPTKFFLNLGGNKFKDVAVEVGLDKPVDIFGATWGDYNNDGYIDLFSNGHIGKGLFKNSGNKNINLVIKLVGNGTTTNTSAIGSKVFVKTGNASQLREVNGGRGCCEQDMLPVHFGVGKDKLADISVKWTDGKSCDFDKVNVESNTLITVEQNECEITTKTLP